MNTINQEPKLLRTTCQEINEQDEHDVNLKHSSKHEAIETSTSKVHQFLTSKYLSQDKLCILQIIQEHFMNVKSGNANGMMYTTPILFITGSPGIGKSWLIKTITELAK